MSEKCDVCGENVDAHLSPDERLCRVVRYPRERVEKLEHIQVEVVMPQAEGGDAQMPCKECQKEKDVYKKEIMNRTCRRHGHQ